MSTTANGAAVMVGEAHHRFYNSLQLVMSATNGILRDGVCDASIRARLEALQDRVIQLADVNRRLAGPFGPEALSEGAVRHLCAALAVGFERPDTVLSIVVDGLVMDSDRCRILVLLLSELITNALKHSPPSQQVRVCITLTTRADHSSLEVCNQMVHVPDAGVVPRVAAELVAIAGGTLEARVETGEFRVAVVLPARDAARDDLSSSCHRAAS